MIKRHPKYIVSDEDREHLELVDWVWNSHYWVEDVHGYCRCKWCGEVFASEQGLSIEYPLCRENPVLRRHVASLSGSPYDELIRQFMKISDEIRKLKPVGGI